MQIMKKNIQPIKGIIGSNPHQLGLPPISAKTMKL